MNTGALNAHAFRHDLYIHKEHKKLGPRMQAMFKVSFMGFLENLIIVFCQDNFACLQIYFLITLPICLGFSEYEFVLEEEFVFSLVNSETKVAIMAVGVEAFLRGDNFVRFQKRLSHSFSVKGGRQNRRCHKAVQTDVYVEEESPMETSDMKFIRLQQILNFIPHKGGLIWRKKNRKEPTQSMK
ncbi:hypothetical protein EGR_11153 [Echinococcus granulosus]|uniref:Uncharacterized protein n=1 Tax=Echinococcus granulosus TaxID=6210 RepID=W6TYY9_ECHGR|nr:hypothetical protein EGR_11153 [Echinococcus granulosus]EUB53990.1 hypothetical protein EGR_11153 [Echinococcus granulosus]